jgi:LmbE family N-acetylglucosaminyl deacetylase
MNKVLVIAAHPDDEVLGMGGTVAKLSAQGVECHLLIVTDGSSSQYRDSDNLKEIIEAKKLETKKCADLLGFKTIHYGELPDMKLDQTPHIVINQVIERTIDKLQPDAVFTHFWGDVNRDHQEVYKSTLVAVRPVMGQVVKELYCYRVPSSTEWTPNKADTMFMPNVFVDIEMFAEQKYKAFSCYSTELRDYPHPRSVQYLRETDKAAGLRVGLLVAEEFVLLRKLD